MGRRRVHDLFDSPAEAAGPVFVDSFEHQEKRANLKDSSTDEGCDSASREDLVFELG